MVALWGEGCVSAPTVSQACDANLPILSVPAPPGHIPRVSSHVARYCQEPSAESPEVYV